MLNYLSSSILLLIKIIIEIVIHVSELIMGITLYFQFQHLLWSPFGWAGDEWVYLIFWIMVKSLVVPQDWNLASNFQDEVWSEFSTFSLLGGLFVKFGGVYEFYFTFQMKMKWFYFIYLFLMLYGWCNFKSEVAEEYASIKTILNLMKIHLKNSIIDKSFKLKY